MTALFSRDCICSSRVKRRNDTLVIRRMGCRRKTIVAVPNNRRHWAVVRRAGSSALIASKRGVVRTARAGTTRADHRSALQRDGGGCERIALSCRRPPTAQRLSRVRVHPAHTAVGGEGEGKGKRGRVFVWDRNKKRTWNRSCVGKQGEHCSKATGACGKSSRTAPATLGSRQPHPPVRAGEGACLCSPGSFA